MAKRTKYHSVATALVALAAIDTHIINFGAVPGVPAFVNEIANRARTALPVVRTPMGALAALLAAGAGSKMLSRTSPHLGSKALGHGIKI